MLFLLAVSYIVQISFHLIFVVRKNRPVTLKRSIVNTILFFLTLPIIALYILSGSTVKEFLLAEKPSIYKITPSIGGLGTDLTIYGAGFTSTNNDIAISYQEDNGLRSTTYMDTVSSTDRKTLRFRYSGASSACARSQEIGGIFDICASGIYFLPDGPTQISVVNRYGQSNKVSFMVIPNKKEAEKKNN